MKTYSLECPTCKRIRIYKSSGALSLSKKLNSNCRNCSTIKYAKRLGNCSILLNETNESYYWIGFILADGHINDFKRLSVTLGIKDTNHLEKLSKYLNVKVTKRDTNCSLSIMDTINIRKLCNIFDINSNKTIYPPQIKIFDINREKLLSLFCGFIDGDGCICNLHNRLDFNLRIKCHSSWIKILNLFSNRFLNSCNVKIDKYGYSLLSCGDSVILKKLKKECVLLNIPLLHRKWDIINLNFKGRNEISKERIIKARYYLSLEYSQNEISKILNVSKSGISLLIKRNKLKI